VSLYRVRLGLFVVVAACSSRSEPVAERAPASPVARRVPAPPAESLHWYAGDVHMHVSPPDDPHDVELSPEQIADKARDAKMDFVVLTPHLWPSRWDQAHHATFRKQWHAFAARARAIDKPTLIPGIEWSARGGHFTVAGVDFDTVGDDVLASAHAAGAFISANHPYAVPTRIPGIPASHYDMSYRVWTDHEPGFTAIDGVEVWNVPLGYANVLSRPGGMTGEQRAWLSANRVVHAEHRPLTAVGGTDNHHQAVAATTWVLATDASEPAIVAALHAGRTCVGGLAGSSFRAHAGGGDWVTIGGVVSTRGTMTLAWDGTARLFVDGVDTGEHDGGFEHDTMGELHTYRIEKDSSRCGFIYANL